MEQHLPRNITTTNWAGGNDLQYIGSFNTPTALNIIIHKDCLTVVGYLDTQHVPISDGFPYMHQVVYDNDNDNE